ncbi:MAG: hypothetical protein QOJ64_884 [Acidobacteriota bacterium]|jgi:hypothetical protein|nr:hypothetical protein [Acidobacteriota bacterium]
MNIRRKNHSRLVLIAFVTLLLAHAFCRTTAAQEKPAAPGEGTSSSRPPDAKKGDAVFKIPKGYMATDKSEIGPMLMLNPKKPAAMFVAYPKQEETVEAFRLRLRTFAAGMFFHENNGAIIWDVKKLEPHAGDGDGTADIAFATQGGLEVEVVIYERRGGVRPFVYGYFAMRDRPSKKNSATFIDATGNGVKEFDELWKSFPN